MKNFLFVLMNMLVTTLGHAQDGVYMTGDDFKNGKMIEADRGTMHYDYGKKEQVTMEVKGVAKEYKMSDIWGISFRDEQYRFTHDKELKDKMIRVIITGSFVYYWREMEVRVDNRTSYKYRDYISKDVNSPVYFITAHLETLEEVLAAHKGDFPDLVKCMKTSSADRSDDLIRFCLLNAPGFELKKGQTLPQKIKGFH